MQISYGSIKKPIYFFAEAVCSLPQAFEGPELNVAQVGVPSFVLHGAALIVDLRVFSQTYRDIQS